MGILTRINDWLDRRRAEKLYDEWTARRRILQASIKQFNALPADQRAAKFAAAQASFSAEQQHLAAMEAEIRSLINTPEQPPC